MPQETTIETQAVVIGSGPGGYVCAIRLAQLGVETVLVEKGALGGVCLNVGCIPSKALISASKLVSQIREAESMGITASDVRVDLRRMMAWKAGIVGKLTGGVGGLVEGNGGRIVRGVASFTSAHTVQVTDAKGGVTEVRFQHAVVATGSVPAELNGFAIDGENIVSSSHALSLDRLPATMAVIGGGYIGMEMGGVYQRLGTQVTVVEYDTRILPGFEKDLVRPVKKRFEAAGGVIRAGTQAMSWSPRSGGGVVVTLLDRKRGTEESLEVDVVLLTVGRRPRTAGLALDQAGLATDEKGFLTVDGAQRTAVPHIYAIGDVAGEPMLAHKASREGEVAAEVIAGHPAAFDARAVPAVVFTDPEVATVGMTKAEAEAAGHEVKVGKFSFAANGRALSLGDADGFVRVVIEAGSELLLGMQVVGPEASNLVAEAALGLEMGAQASDIGMTIHAHPTLAEAVMEATNAALGQAVHAINR